MAKGARASTIKSNNAKLKANVFGPVETARTERLSAKLLELASAPKPERDQEMKDVGDCQEVEEAEEPIKDIRSVTETMELDEPTSSTRPARQLSKTQIKKRIEKRKSCRSRSSIVFPKYRKGKK